LDEISRQKESKKQQSVKIEDEIKRKKEEKKMNKEFMQSEQNLLVNRDN
jgi:hypothetical protein